MGKEYLEKLKDPRWQKLRLRVFERDDWCCQICCDTEKTLHVHHRRYVSGKLPWEYSLEDLTTLCSDCHKDEYELREGIESGILEVFRMSLFSSHIDELSQAFYKMPFLMHVDPLISAIAWNIEKNQQAMLDAYFSAIKKKD